MNQEKETRYFGYFVMDSGLKVKFDVSEEEGGEKFARMLDCEFPFERGDTIWLGNYFLLADKIIGFSIDTYEKKS